MFKYVLSLNCSHINKKWLFSSELGQKNTAIQKHRQEGVALYHQVHELQILILSRWKRDTEKC
jgi:hypothetical protein